MPRSIRVLHVDDDPDLASLVATYLESESDRLDVTTATSGPDGLDRLVDAEFDCIVSDYDMPGMDGIDFLERVRETNPDLPFILFTGKGSEEVASDAISAGVTDYLQKETGTDQYAILANRIENAVEREVDWHRTVLDEMGEGVYVLTADYEFQFVNLRISSVDGASEDAWTGRSLSYLAESGVLSAAEVDWIRAGVDSLLDGESDEVRVEIEPSVPAATDVVELRLKTIDVSGEESLVLGTTRDISDRKGHERELQQYETLIERTTDIVTVLDSEGIVQYQSPSIERVLGYDPAELEGDFAFDYVHPDDHERVREVFSDLVTADEEATTRVEFRFEHADGSWRWLESEAKSCHEAALGGYVVTSRDVTERKAGERERALYAAIADNMADGAFVVDGDWYLEHANETALSYAGVSHATLEGQPVLALTRELAASDAGVDRFEAALAEAFELPAGAEVSTSAELDLDFERGTATVAYHLTPVRIDGETKVVITARDVTDRRHREEALGTLHEVTREFMDATDQQAVAAHAVETADSVLDQPLAGVWLYDERTDALEPAAVTERGQDVFGQAPTYERGEGLSWNVFESGEGRIFADLRDEPARYNPDTPIRSEILRPLGEYGVMVFGRTEPDAFDDIDVALARILADTVEAALVRADRESELRAQHRRLTRQNERLDEFASVISHDLRNPLQVLEGSLEQAAATGEEAHFERASDAVERMDALITDLLALAREGEAITDAEPVDLAALAAGCWGNVETSGGTLDVATNATVEADRSRLKQLLENLFRNAIEHAASEETAATPTATGASDGSGNRVTVTIGDLTDDAGFFVADDGPGIPPDERETVFEAGHSTNPDGTGFGLAIVEGIADAHGWTVRVTDSVDGGARFEFVTA